MCVPLFSSVNPASFLVVRVTYLTPTQTEIFKCNFLDGCALWSGEALSVFPSTGTHAWNFKWHPIRELALPRRQTPIICTLVEALIYLFFCCFSSNCFHICADSGWKLAWILGSLFPFSVPLNRNRNMHIAWEQICNFQMNCIPSLLPDKASVQSYGHKQLYIGQVQPF